MGTVTRGRPGALSAGRKKILPTRTRCGGLVSYPGDGRNEYRHG